MTVPPIPQFPDPDKHTQKTNLYKKIRETLIKLAFSLPNPKNRETVLRFTDCINPGDISRLPYISDKPTAQQPNRAACLFALISWMIQVYWMFCLGDETGGHQVEVRTYLFRLVDVLINGISAYKVIGNPVDGYVLEKK